MAGEWLVVDRSNWGLVKQWSMNGEGMVGDGWPIVVNELWFKVVSGWLMVKQACKYFMVNGG